MIDESTECTLDANGSLHVRLQDGSGTEKIPDSCLSRSATLQETVSVTVPGESFTLPAIWFRAWLCCARLLESSTQLPLHPLRSCHNSRLVAYIQAADFFADEKAVRALCSVLAHRVFGAPSNATLNSQLLPQMEDPRNSADAQEEKRPAVVLTSLSDDLIISVLKASPHSLDHHIRNLPEACHRLAVQAALPAILTEGSLTLDCADCSLTTTISALHTFCQQPSPERLSLSNSPAAVRLSKSIKKSNESLDQFMLSLKRALKKKLLVVSLKFDGFPCIETRIIRSVLSTAVQNTALQHLELSLPRSSCMCVAAWVQGISELRALRSFKLHNIHLVHSPMNAYLLCTPLHIELAQLWQLTHLALTCDKISSDTLPSNVAVYSAEPLSQCISSMHSLQSLELSCYVHKRSMHGEQLLAAIQDLPVLSKLVLATVFTSPTVGGSVWPCWDPFMASPASFSGLQNLKVLDVSGMVLDGRKSCFLPLAASVQTLRGLQSLSLRSAGRCKMHEHCNWTVARFLGEDLKSLTSLTLVYEKTLPYDSAKRVMNAIGKISMLQHLSLQLSAPAPPHLCRLPMERLLQLTSLSLKPSPYDMAGHLQKNPRYMGILPIHLAGLCELRHLSLEGILILPPGGERRLRYLTALESLSLHDFGCPENVCSILLESLKELTCLTRLSICSPVELLRAGLGIWNRKVRHELADSLSHLVELQELELCPGRIDLGMGLLDHTKESDGAWLNKALQGLTKLRTLALEHFAFAPKLWDLVDPLFIFPATPLPLPVQTSLTHLSLSGCRFRNGPEAWCCWFSSMQDLHTLNLSNLKVDFGEIFQTKLVKTIQQLPKLHTLAVEREELGRGIAHWEQILLNAPSIRSIGPLVEGCADASSIKKIRTLLSQDPLRCSRLAGKCGLYSKLTKDVFPLGSPQAATITSAAFASIARYQQQSGATSVAEKCWDAVIAFTSCVIIYRFLILCRDLSQIILGFLQHAYSPL